MRQFSSIITKHQRQPTYKERSTQSVGFRVYDRAVHNGGDWEIIELVSLMSHSAKRKELRTLLLSAPNDLKTSHWIPPLYGLIII